MYLATTVSLLLTKYSLDLFYKKGEGYYLPIVTFFYSPYPILISHQCFRNKHHHLSICFLFIRKHIMYLLSARLLFLPIPFVQRPFVLKPFSVVPPLRNIVFYVCWTAESGS